MLSTNNCSHHPRGDRRLRVHATADVIAVAEQKVQDLQQQINAYRDLSTSMALEEM
jgi:hypothetical protein